MQVQVEGRAYHVYQLTFGCYSDKWESWWLHEDHFTTDEIKLQIQTGAVKFFPVWEEWKKRHDAWTLEKFGFVPDRGGHDYVREEHGKVMRVQLNDSHIPTFLHVTEIESPTALEDLNHYLATGYLDEPRDIYERVMKLAGFIPLEPTLHTDDVCRPHDRFLSFINSIGLEYVP